jgi:AAA+ ATPase superfamily predicted ATPase
MENPFQYGSTVSGKSFANRKNEIKEIMADIKSGLNLFIYSPRRYGKTSIIKVILARLKKENFAAIYLDFYKIYSKDRFIDLYSRTIADEAGLKKEKVIAFFRRHVKNVIPSIGFDDDGKPRLRLEYSSRKSNISELLEDIYQLPQRLAVEKKRKVVVVFDEFQEIENLDGEKFEKELRAHIQHHERVSYVFMGSKTHILLNMFNDKKRPFYRIGKMFYLDKLSKEDLVKFIIARFKEGSYSISVDTAELICSLSKGHPYYAQMLCHEIWEATIEKKEVDRKAIDISFDRIIRNHSELYFRTWDSLSAHQKRLLVALVRSGGKSILSRDYREENKLSGTSTVSKSISALIEKEVVEKNDEVYEVPDIFLAKWVEERIV